MNVLPSSDDHEREHCCRQPPDPSRRQRRSPSRNPQSRQTERRLDDALRALAAVHDDLSYATAISVAPADPEDRYRSLNASVQAVQTVIREYLTHIEVNGAMKN
jgi:hypothetical protein